MLHLRNLLALALPAGAYLSAAAVVRAQTQAWSGVCISNEVATIQGFQCLVANILSVSLTVIGLTAFAIFIAASFRYMLAGTNAQSVTGARNSMTYAIAGIVVALSAFIIINLLSAFTGVSTIKNFSIPNSDKIW